MCNDGVLEDELHFLLKCAKYTKARDVLLSKIVEHIAQFETMSTTEQFYNILADQSVIVQEAAGHYLKVSLRH